MAIPMNDADSQKQNFDPSDIAASISARQTVSTDDIVPRKCVIHTHQSNLDHSTALMPKRGGAAQEHWCTVTSAPRCKGVEALIVVTGAKFLR